MTLTPDQLHAMLAYANNADGLDVSDEEIRTVHRRVAVYAEVARRAWAYGYTAGIAAHLREEIALTRMAVDLQDSSCPDCVCCIRLRCHRGEGSECRGGSCPCTEG
jgi:hypothetical protein